MKFVWSFVGILGFIVAIFVLCCIIVLSLVPTYLSINENGIDNTGRTQPFSFVCSFSTSNDQNLTSLVDHVDVSSHSNLETFVSRTLRKWTALPSSVNLNIMETILDDENKNLYLLGNYRFPLFCNRKCQNRILEKPYVIQNSIQNLNNISISNINETISVAISKDVQDIMISSIKAINERLEDPIHFSITLQPLRSRRSLRRRRRRQQPSNANQNSAEYKLIRQLLDLSKKARNITFNIIINNKNVSGNTQLNITVVLRYSLYCTTRCAEGIIVDIYNTLLSPIATKDITYDYDNSKHYITGINLVSFGKAAPASFFTLSYDLGNQSNATEGPITDSAALKNLTDGIQKSLKETEAIEVVKAEYVPKSESKALSSLSSNKRKRRLIRIRYTLVVIIRFIRFDSACNFVCQRKQFGSVITQIGQPPPIFFSGFYLILPWPLVASFYQSRPITTTTTTTTPTPTFSSTPAIG